MRPPAAGSGRKKGSKNKSTLEVRDLAQQLITDPAYRANLLKRLQKGKIAPAVECMLWHYGYGKPRDTLALEGADGLPLTFTLQISGSERDS